MAVEAGLELAVADPTAHAELRAALESVFPVSAVSRFVTLAEGERLTQLAELARICTGVWGGKAGGCKDWYREV